MIEESQIGGIRIDIGTSDEYLTAIRNFLESEKLHTVEFVGPGTFLQSAKHTEVAECLNTADLVIPVNEFVTNEINADREPPMEPVLSRTLLHSVLKEAVQDDRKVYLIMETNEMIAAFIEHLNQEADLAFAPAGSYAIESEGEGEEETAVDIINDINALTPDLVLVVMDCPTRERFLLKHYNAINARIWIMMSVEKIFRDTGSKPLQRLLTHHKVRRQIQAHPDQENS